MKIEPFAIDRKHPDSADGDGAQIVVVADAGEDEILALRRLRRGEAAKAPPCSATHFSALAAVRL